MRGRARSGVWAAHVLLPAPTVLDPGRPAPAPAPPPPPRGLPVRLARPRRGPRPGHARARAALSPPDPRRRVPLPDPRPAQHARRPCPRRRPPAPDRRAVPEAVETASARRRGRGPRPCSRPARCSPPSPRSPSVYRGVVVAVDVQGCSYQEAAERLGVPVGTVMSRLYRGRRRVVEAVEGTASRALSLDPPIISLKEGAKSSCGPHLPVVVVEDVLSSLSALVAHRVGWSCPGFSIPLRAVRRPDESGSWPGQGRRRRVGGWA